MKKIYKSIFMLAMIAGVFSLNSFGQREVAVASMANGGVIDGLPLAIEADSAAREAAYLADGTTTAYVLEPGGIYPIVSLMDPSYFYLHIKSSGSLTDPKPRLVPSPRADNGFNDFIEFRSPLGGKLENLYITGMRTYLDGAIDANRHNIKLYAGARVEIYGCEIAHDVPGALISIWEDGSSLWLEDCLLHSSGHHRSAGGNGRIISPRANMDTISLVNCSFFNFTDRIFRNMGAEIGYTKIDHCTGLNSAGYHGGLQLGSTHEVVITNNIFGNMITLGSDTARVAGGSKNEQTQPEDNQMFVITLDEVLPDAKITIRNNNMYWDQDYKDLWAANSAKVAAPGTLTPTITGALGGSAADAVMEEVLAFAVAPPSYLPYTTDAFIDPLPEPMAENFYFGDDVDLAYGTTAASYSAGDRGFPLGDLNQYPDDKALWAAGGTKIQNPPREVLVKSMGNDGVIDGLPLAIKADSAARQAAYELTGQTTAYVLEPGGIYPIVSLMDPTYFYLHIKSSGSLTDPKPRLVPSPREDNGFNDFIEFRSPLGGKLENLYITGMRTYLDGAIDANRHNIKLYAGARVEIFGCEIAHDVPGALISIWEDGSSLWLEDCLLHSSGHHRSAGGNGRIISPRANMDTISLVNCSFFNFTDRIFRNMGAEIGYTKIDHCTGLNSAGYHGGLQLGSTHEVEVTNNIFGNMITLGSDTARVAGGSKNEQTQPEDDQMYVITLDEVFPDSKITIRNNNMYWDQAYTDLWAANSSQVAAPGTITATIIGALEGNEADAVMDEALVFTVEPPSLVPYTTDMFMVPRPEPLAENFYFGEDVDLGYDAGSDTYTAADDGFPLGDLNWYPALKAAWEAGSGPEVGIEENFKTEKLNMTSFPNPFSGQATLRFNLDAPSNVTIDIFDITGKSVRRIDAGQRAAGVNTIEIQQDGMNSGIYILRMNAGNNSGITKISVK